MNQQTGEVREISMEVWDTYKEFLDLLTIEKNETLRVIAKHPDLKGFIVKRLFQKALDDAQGKTGTKLTNLWDYFKMKNVGGFYEYFAPDFENPIDIRKNNSKYTK